MNAGTDAFGLPSEDLEGDARVVDSVDIGAYEVSSASGNVAPVAVADDGYSTPYQTILTISDDALLANDSDPDGDDLRLVSVSEASGGSANLNSAGDVVFDPADGQSGDAGFSYTVSDGRGGTATAEVSIQIEPAPEPDPEPAPEPEPEPEPSPAPDSGVIYRWNAGSSTVAAVDGGRDWLADAGAIVGSASIATHEIDISGTLDASVPGTTPEGIFAQEYWGDSASAGMGLEFGGGTLEDGLYAVRLFMGNGFAGTDDAGERVFDVSVEGELFLDDLDLSGTLGHRVGGMYEWQGAINDGTLDVDFDYEIQNPLINGVEVLRLEPEPEPQPEPEPEPQPEPEPEPQPEPEPEPQPEPEPEPQPEPGDGGDGETFRLWNGTTTPDQLTDPDTGSVELGLRFRAEADGEITAIRFYQGPENDGPHPVTFWTGDGDALAGGRVDGSGTGWQEVDLDIPVAVTAGDVSVASYHAPEGHYSVSDYYFTQEVANAPLAALKNGGVYNYGAAGSFPEAVFHASNYWVDVVFEPTEATHAGTSQSERLRGGSGDDVMLGGAGNDRLLGQSSDDIIRGQDGNDAIFGGAGHDILIGGEGDDQFRFRSTSDSRPGEGIDEVRAGDGAVAMEGVGAAWGDVIDVSGIDADRSASGNQSFVFGDTGKGGIWLADRDGTTVVRANVDDDATAEFELVIDDGDIAAATYVAEDFLL